MSENKKYILAVYRNIPQDGYIDDLQIEEATIKDYIVRDQIIPGAQNFPDMYIKKHHYNWGILITYSYAVLSKKEITAIAQRVIKLIC